MRLKYVEESFAYDGRGGVGVNNVFEAFEEFT